MGVFFFNNYNMEHISTFITCIKCVIHSRLGRNAQLELPIETKSIYVLKNM